LLIKIPPVAQVGLTSVAGPAGPTPGIKISITKNIGEEIKDYYRVLYKNEFSLKTIKI